MYFQKGDFSDLVEFMVAIFKGNIGPISNDVTAWYPIYKPRLLKRVKQNLFLVLIVNFRIIYIGKPRLLKQGMTLKK